MTNYETASRRYLIQELHTRNKQLEIFAKELLQWERDYEEFKNRHQFELRSIEEQNERLTKENMFLLAKSKTEA